MEPGSVSVGKLFQPAFRGTCLSSPIGWLALERQWKRMNQLKHQKQNDSEWIVSLFPDNDSIGERRVFDVVVRRTVDVTTANMNGQRSLHWLALG